LNKRKQNYSKKRGLPLKLVFIISISILIGDAFIEELLFLFFPTIPDKYVPFIDALLLITLLLPVLYFYLYRPIITQLEETKRAEEVLRTLALFDELTGLYNRRGFMSLSDQFLRLSNRTKRGLILVFADVDNMKQINDTFGHAEGDRALICTARVLQNTFRGSDVIGRVGGGMNSRCSHWKLNTKAWISSESAWLKT